MRLALFAGLGALLLGAAPLLDGPAATAPAPSAERARRGGPVNCEQGPRRVTEMEIGEPETAPSTNDTVVILRQLEALVNDDQEYGSRLQRIA